MFLNFQDDVKVTLKIGKILFFLIIYLHLIACLWFYVIRGDKEWIPLSDLDIQETDLYETSWLD